MLSLLISALEEFLASFILMIARFIDLIRELISSRGITTTILFISFILSLFI